VKDDNGNKHREKSGHRIITGGGDDDETFRSTEEASVGAAAAAAAPPPQVTQTSSVCSEMDEVKRRASDLLLKLSAIAGTASVCLKWGGRDVVVRQVAREEEADLTPERFEKEYDVPKVPVIVQRATRSWRAAVAWRNTRELEMRLRWARVGGSTLGGPVLFPMLTKHFLEAYCPKQQDATPLYLFEEIPPGSELAGDYSVPAFLPYDYLELLGPPQRRHRPPPSSPPLPRLHQHLRQQQQQHQQQHQHHDLQPVYQWLVIGPTCSGAGQKSSSSSSSPSSCIVA